MRSHAVPTLNRQLLLIAALTFALLATLLPATGAQAQTATQAVPDDQIQVSEDVPLRHDDPRETRGRDSAGVAVNPTDPDHIVMVNADLYHFTCEAHVSTDGGASWKTSTLTAPAGFGAPAGSPTEPCSPIGHGTSALMGSHAVTFGSGDNVYVAFGSAREGEDLSALVAHSTDGGENFGTATVAIPWEGATNDRLPGIVALPRDGQPDRLVVVAADTTSPTIGGEPSGAPTPQSAVAAVSEDGGTTWSDRVQVTDVPAQEIIVSQDPAGPVYVSYRNREGEVGGAIRVARSEDGLTWENFHATDVIGYQEPADAPQYAGNDYSGFANFPRSETGPDGTVYIVYMEGPPVDSYPVLPGDVEQQDHYIHPNAEVKLIASTDGGQTWSAPTVVNDDPPTAEAGNLWHQVRHPDVSVAPNGRVDVVWHDRRHWYRGCQHVHAACNEGRFGDTYHAHSEDQGETFSDDLRVSDRTQNNEIGSDYRQGVYWLYSPVSVPLGDEGLLVAWMDSRQGNFENDALDIYYSKVDFDHDGDTPVRRIPASDATDLSVALARHAYPGGSEATLTSTFATEETTRVVVVNQDDPAAALVGAVLGRAYMGPVLATPAGGLTPSLRDEIARIDPHGTFVLGDTGAVSDQAETELEQDTETATVRFGGTPAEMAADVARQMDWRGGDQYSRPLDAPAFEAVVVVNPDTDEGTTAAALAANRRLPVLFVESDSIPAATTQALADLDIDETLVVGGEASVNDSVLNALPNATRLGGSDIFAVSRAVAQESLDRGLPANVVYVSGDDPMEAALTGAAAGRISGLQLVTADGDTGAAQTAADGLGVGDKVDRFIVSGDLPDRAALTWACPTGAVPASGFTDVAGSVHENAIECAFWYGITAGGPGGLPATQYGPALSVRRDQMASFIARMIDHAKPGLLPAATGANPFPGDLTDSNVHYDAIRRLAAAGIVQGGPGGLPADQYGPDQSVRRDQMASFIRRAIDEIADEERAEIVNDAAPFSDAAQVHLDNINALASEGIVLGVSADEYAGGNAVRRDQMASFVNRGLDFLVQHKESLWPELVVR